QFGNPELWLRTLRAVTVRAFGSLMSATYSYSGFSKTSLPSPWGAWAPDAVTCFEKDAAPKMGSGSTGALGSAFRTPKPCDQATLPPSIHVTQAPGTGATFIQEGRELRNSLGGALFHGAAKAGAANVARKLRRYITILYAAASERLRN